MVNVDRPHEVLYGLSEVHGSLFVVGVAEGRELASEVRAVKACRSVGEAVDLDAVLRRTRVPGLPDEDERSEPELDRSAPYDWRETEAIADGDWPPMLTALSLGVFARDDLDAWNALQSEAVSARRVSTSLNGDYLDIPADHADC